MPLHNMSEDELRNHCKRHLEALELWLRRLIHDQLTDAFGADYINAVHTDGSNVVNNTIRGKLEGRLRAEPDRYTRPIDAATLEVEIDLICKPQLYKTYFGDALAGAFPIGREQARSVLSRLEDPRNKLAHANSISVRQAEQVICYSGDIIDSLRSRYREIGMAQSYNVPTIISITDSFGTTFHADQIPRNNTGAGIVDRQADESATLRCGDILSIEAEIDPSFDASSYDVRWSHASMQGENPTGKKFVVHLNERHVSIRFMVSCVVTSKQDWHRLGGKDDQVSMIYKVLPPLD